MPFVDFSQQPNNIPASDNTGQNALNAVSPVVPVQSTQSGVQTPVSGVREYTGPNLNPPQTQNQFIPNQTQNTSINVQGGMFLDPRLSPKVSNIWAYLDITEKRNASDLHFTVGYPPMLRIDGRLERICPDNLEKKRALEIFQEILTKEQIEELIKYKEVDFSIQNKSGNRFRVNLYNERGNLAGAFRLIPSHIKNLQELDLPDIVNDFYKLPHGLILVTGPTGSGKSTTIAGIVNEINLRLPKHIITLEDPIEYMFPKAIALMDQREIHKDTLSFQNALRAALREDPDVVLVGEMRDFETISSTITVAETGHLVFATLHTNSASQTIDRIIDVFPEHQQSQIKAQLANVLQAVVSQRLVPLKGGGRKAIIEILIGTAAVRNAIREGKTYQIDNMIQTGADVGMIPLEKSLAELVRSGQVDIDTAIEFTTKPDQLRELVGR